MIVCTLYFWRPNSGSKQWIHPWLTIWPHNLACICETAATHWSNLGLVWEDNYISWRFNMQVSTNNLCSLLDNRTSSGTCNSWMLHSCIGCKVRPCHLLCSMSQREEPEPCNLQISCTWRLCWYNMPLWNNWQLYNTISELYFLHVSITHELLSEWAWASPCKMLVSIIREEEGYHGQEHHKPRSHWMIHCKSQCCTNEV